ncbi:MAG TPA: prenyltransferase/squalene oxidase repeat-containing protein [Planctomycetaceae bacterium]|nr:prenyltransferase/squalene oxidase repeat-containing protein [Planctomycetaceae bacterium]
MRIAANLPELRARLARSLDVLPSLLASFVLHVVVLLALGLIVLRFAPPSSEIIPIEAFGNDAANGPVEAIDRVDFVETPLDKPQDTIVDNNDARGVSVGKLADVASVPPIDFEASSLRAAEKVQLSAEPKVGFTAELTGRSGAARSTLLVKGGGTGDSERAVTLSLRWLARHQQSDGQWSFHHGSDDPGSLEKCTTGATGLAILSFLGAGHTHRSEHVRFQKNVDKGLKYLVSQMKGGKEGGDLRGQVVSNEGMYAQAIATLALCEAYGLTRDEKLMEPAQQAINFIVSAQDPKKGGWRYSPREAGDTTVTGWQVMALKSAKSSGLKVPSYTLAGATKFLDSVQTAGGSRYGYDRSGGNPPMTAIGLLCRMYLGWKQNAVPLKRGVQYLSSTGPSPGDIYYDYYATQVLHHWGGPEWRKWNEVLRDHLIESQVKEGDAAGSWKPTGDRGAAAGGRLYQTCLSVMTLEVYYRYLPLYQKETAGR